MADIMVLATQNVPVRHFLERKADPALIGPATEFWASMRAAHEALEPGQYLAIPSEWS